MARGKNTPNSSLYDISQRLMRLRESKGLTQEQLADMVGVKKSTISGYERDANFPSLEVLVKLSNIFNVTTDELLGLSNYEKNSIEKAYYENLLKNTINIQGISDKNRKLIEDLINVIRLSEKK